MCCGLLGLCTVGPFCPPRVYVCPYIKLYILASVHKCVYGWVFLHPQVIFRTLRVQILRLELGWVCRVCRCRIDSLDIKVKRFRLQDGNIFVGRGQIGRESK